MRRRRTWIVTSVVAAVAGLGPLRADDQAPATVAGESPDNWLAARVAELENYELTIDGQQSDVGPVLVGQPVLNWSNPIRQTDRGAMFLWTAANGRPLLCCCCYVVDESVVHEMISVAERPLLVEPATAEGKTFEPPEQFQSIPDSPTPSRNRSLRLAQMRKEAARFEVEIVGQNLVFDTRLLRQPVYRYPTGMDVDGAVFAFVQGTDPECLLVIESRENGFVSRAARVTNWRFRLLRDGAVAMTFAGGGDRTYGKFWRMKD